MKSLTRAPVNEGKFDRVIVKKYLIEALAGNEDLDVEIDNNPRFFTDAIRIMRGSVEAMRIVVDEPIVVYQKDGGPIKKTNVSDPDLVHKIIKELTDDV